MAIHTTVVRSAGPADLMPLLEMQARSMRQLGYARRDASATHAAGRMPKIRSIYVDPMLARRGLGRLIMARVEAEISAAGFDEAELVATLNGVTFYGSLGFTPGRPVALD